MQERRLGIKKRGMTGGGWVKMPLKGDKEG